MLGEQASWHSSSPSQHEDDWDSCGLVKSVLRRSSITRRTADRLTSAIAIRRGIGRIVPVGGVRNEVLKVLHLVHRLHHLAEKTEPRTATVRAVPTTSAGTLAFAIALAPAATPATSVVAPTITSIGVPPHDATD